MEENKKIVEVNEAEITEVEETEETKKEGIFKRGVGFVKRNGKKIGTGVLIGVGLVAAYALGKRTSGDGSEECDDSEIEFVEVDEADVPEAEVTNFE